MLRTMDRPPRTLKSRSLDRNLTPMVIDGPSSSASGPAELAVSSIECGPAESPLWVKSGHYTAAMGTVRYSAISGHPA